MKMIKKIIFYIAILSLSSCGYEAIYLKTAGFDKVIQSFQTEGDKKINRKIISALNLKKQTKTSGYKLIINSSRSLEIASKDSTGRTSAFNLRVDVVVSLMDGDKIFKTKNFTSDFTYNNTENKYDLSQYQNGVELNLINHIIEEIFIFLTF